MSEIADVEGWNVLFSCFPQYKLCKVHRAARDACGEREYQTVKGASAPKESVICTDKLSVQV